MKKRIPNDVDIDQIFFFVQEMSDQNENNAKFWKGEDMPGDGIETIFARTEDGDTMIGTIDVADNLEKLAAWLSDTMIGTSDVADNLEKLAAWLRTLTEAND